MPQIRTVNVVEICEGIVSIHSYTPDDEGVILADTLFLKLAEEQGYDLNDVKKALEMGFIIDEEYELRIVHSW